MSNFIMSAISGLVKPISSMYNKRQDRKIQKEAGQAKLSQAKQDGATEITLSDSEWEAIAVSQNTESWKDEYVTVIGTLPYVLIFVGAIYFAFTGDPALLEGTTDAIEALAKIGVDMGEVMMTVIYAAVGLKAWRGVTR